MNKLSIILGIILTIFVIFIFATKDNLPRSFPSLLTDNSNSAPLDLPTEKPSPTPNSTVLPSISPIPTILTTPSPKPSQTPFTIPEEIVWGNRNKQQIIITFDAGAGSQSTNAILSIYKKYNLKATFFITGKWAEQNQDFIKRIAADGHEIFNHTYNHPHLTQISDEEINSEFNKTDQLIFNLTGKHTTPYFRPPYGERNQHVLTQAAKLGYRSVYWTIDALDWKESEGYTAEQVKQRITSNLNPGSIFLMHMGDNITGNILEDVILQIQSKGYKIVPLSQGL